MAADMIDILVLPGDGIGPEITAATLAVLRAAAGERLAFTEMAIGEASLAAEGSTLPDAVMTAIPRADGVVRGPVSHYSYPAGPSNPSAALRTGFNLSAKVRPCRSRPGLRLSRDPLQLLLVREQTTGFPG